MPAESIQEGRRGADGTRQLMSFTDMSWCDWDRRYNHAGCVASMARYTTCVLSLPWNWLITTVKGHPLQHKLDQPSDALLSTLSIKVCYSNCLTGYNKNKLTWSSSMLILMGEWRVWFKVTWQSKRRVAMGWSIATKLVKWQDLIYYI